MKCLIVLFFLFSCLSINVAAQRIPLGSDGIELTTSLAESALFESVLSYMENEGFTIQKADEELNTIATDYKIESGRVSIRILTSIENGVVVFTGEAFYEANGQSVRDEPLVNEGEPSEPIRAGFLLLNALTTRYAQTLEQVTIEYVLP